MLKAIAHPVRLEIIQTLSEGSDANCCVDFTKHASLAQSTVSQHLATLRHARVLAPRKVGTNTCYRVVDKRIVSLVKSLNG